MNAQVKQWSLTGLHTQFLPIHFPFLQRPPEGQLSLSLPKAGELSLPLPLAYPLPCSCALLVEAPSQFPFPSPFAGKPLPLPYLPFPPAAAPFRDSPFPSPTPPPPAPVPCLVHEEGQDVQQRGVARTRLMVRLDADPVAALVRYCSLAVILQVWQFEVWCRDVRNEVWLAVRLCAVTGAVLLTRSHPAGVAVSGVAHSGVAHNSLSQKVWHGVSDK